MFTVSGVAANASRASLWAMWFLAGALVLSGQTEKAHLSGTILDTTKAVVPGAQVAVTNVQTGIKRTVSSSEVGLFAVLFLDPAIYDILVQKEGFRSVTRTGIKLDVAQTARIDFVLEVGSTTETLTVVSEAPLLEQGSSSLGHLIENTRIVNLPLNGRNSFAFVSLVPGVRPSRMFKEVAYSMYNDQFVSINGSRPNQSQFLLDGGANAEPAFNGPALFPSVDMVEEYKVQTNNFSAEFSKTAGGIINLLTKSGTNELHGTLFDFFRHDKLTANDFFVNRAGLKEAPFRFHQFGVTAGGPVVLPRLYKGRDRTFFFVSYEGLRWTRGITSTGTMPTELERQGDFSQTRNQAGQVIAIYDSLTTRPDPARPGRFLRSAFPGNMIPAGRIDPVARNILGYLPKPNVRGSEYTNTNNFTSNFTGPIRKDTFSARVDQSFTSNQKLYARFTMNNTYHTRPAVYGPQLRVSSPVAGDSPLHQRSAVVNYTNVLQPTVVLELSSSFLRYWLYRKGPGADFDPVQLGFPSYLRELQPALLPCFPGGSISGLGVAVSDPDTGGGLLASCGYLDDSYETFHEYGNLTHIRGSHTLKFGGNFGTDRLATHRYRPATIGINFGPAFTQGPDPVLASREAGVGFGSFLLGIGSGSINSDGPGQNLLYRYYGLYFQDDWKATAKLTFNLGFRYDYNAPWTERFNRITNFDFNSPSPLQVPGLTLRGGLAYPGVGGLPRSHFDPDRNNFAPRFGFAYSLNQSTVVRGGYGIFMAPITGGGFNGAAVPISGFQSSTTWVGSLDGITPLNYLSNPFPDGFVRATGSRLGLGTLLGQGVVGMDRNRLNPYAQQWNLNVQRTLPGNFVLDLAYAGSRGLSLFGNLSWTVLANELLGLGDRLRELVPNPFYGKIASGSLSNPQVQRIQLLVPYAQFTSVTGGNASWGASSYHALEVKLERRFARGFNLLAAYTFSKLLDNAPSSTTGFPGEQFSGGAIQDWNNLRNERSVASYDAPHYLAINSVWEMPVGPRKRYLSGQKLLGAVLGGWQLNGIVMFRSGVPLGMGVASNTLFNNGGAQRPNWNGKSPSFSGPISERISRYFDTSVFSQPAPYTFGNTPRHLSLARAPGMANLDLSLFKNIPVGEKVRLQFRVEAFNALNHPEFGMPNTSIGSPSAGVISTQQNMPRDIQFALKIIY